MNKAIRCIKDGHKQYWNGGFLSEIPTWYEDKNKLYFDLYNARLYFKNDYVFKIVKPSKSSQTIETLTSQLAEVQATNQCLVLQNHSLAEQLKIAKTKVRALESQLNDGEDCLCTVYKPNDPKRYHTLNCPMSS
jgi:hypothetical protein